MKPNSRKVLAICIENGIRRGMARAHKHTETPSQSDIEHSIDQCLWEEIDEMFDFPEPQP